MAVSMVNHNDAMRGYYDRKLKGNRKRELHKKEGVMCGGDQVGETAVCSDER
ncbi:MAG: hypothetical protein KAJ15_12935 [Spirochaetes bacterium]|nr:hypothetical protein [Spirochaetota bacterium]